MEKRRYLVLPLRLVVLILLSCSEMVLDGLIQASPLVPMTITAGEICNNGIDDDGDGQIDAFDADCNCTEPTSILENGGFELHDGCCSEIFIDNVSCIQGWFSVSGSPDYFHQGCGISSNEPHIGLGQLAIAGGRFTDESIGQCLSSPMQVGRSYQFSIEIRASVGTTMNDLMLYGVPNCDSLLSARSEQFCEIKDSNDLIEMIRIESDRIGTSERTLQFEYTCTQPICAIFLGPTCENAGPIATNQFEYLHIDNIALTATPASWNFSGSILVQGSSCTEEIAFSVEDHDSLSYQWYRNEIPISGAVQAALTVSDIVASDAFHVYIHNEQGCILLGPAEVESGDVRIEIIDSFCLGSTYRFRGNEYIEAGVFNERITNTGACDSIFNLNLTTTDGFENYDTMQMRCDGSVQFVNDILTDPGDYRADFISTDGCDSTVFLNLQPAQSDTTELVDSFCQGTVYTFGVLQIEQSGTYSDLLSNSQGCDSLVTIDLSHREILTDTMRVDLVEGERFDFLGKSYTNFGVFEIMQEAQGEECPQTIILEIQPKSPFEYFIPNAIHPFSSNTNESLVMHTSELVTIEEVRIFNRWGGQVFASKEFQGPSQSAMLWDGKIDGKLAEPGVYVYSVLAIDGEGVALKLAGDVTVIY